MSGPGALPPIRDLVSVPPLPTAYFRSNLRPHSRPLPDAIYFIAEVAQQRGLIGKNPSAPGNHQSIIPAKRSMIPAAQEQPTPPADTPPLSPASPLSSTPLSMLADIALGKENSSMSRGEQAKPQPPTPPITTMPLPKRARPAAPDAAPRPVAAPGPLASGSQVYTAPRPVPKPAPQPAAAPNQLTKMFVKFTGGLHADYRVLPVLHMIQDLTLQNQLGEFPSPHLKRIIEANLAFSKRQLNPQESSTWQKTRDTFFSKELAASSTSEELQGKLQQLIQMEAQLEHQAPNCFKIKELDLTDFIEQSDYLDTLVQLRSLEKLTLGCLHWAQEASELSKLPSLHILSIKDCNLKGTDWKNFPALPSLISLSLGSCMSLETQHLRFLPSQLQTLELYHPRYLNGTSLPELCNRFSQLRRLKLEEASISPSSDLSPFRRLTQLTSLVLKTQSHFSFELNRGQLLQLAQEGAFPQLADLELGLLNEKVDQDTQNDLKKLPAIKSLILHYKEMPSEVWKAPERMETEAG
ncbi:MAG: hypothetical protein LLG04_16440 [Parachlamydia sp.]|nr:hypothetical protein [Parachlamydia sp.]